MRLDKFLALQGLGSRKEIKALLRAGRIAVDGQPVRDAGLVLDASRQVVHVDGVPALYRESLHLMLHKPVDVVTAASDPWHRTVMDLLPAYALAMQCMPVGRLDIDTEGLLLLTTDGPLAYRLLSPKRHVDKVYEATVDAPLTTADIDAFAAGLVLSDFVAQPATLRILDDPCMAHVTLREGRFHQVKRMFAARDRQVLRLRRIEFGGLTLDPALAPGDFRPLSEAELTQLRHAAGGLSDA